MACREGHSAATAVLQVLSDVLLEVDEGNVSELNALFDLKAAVDTSLCCSDYTGPALANRRPCSNCSSESTSPPLPAPLLPILPLPPFPFPPFPTSPPLLAGPP